VNAKSNNACYKLCNINLDKISNKTRHLTTYLPVCVTKKSAAQSLDQPLWMKAATMAVGQHAIYSCVKMVCRAGKSIRQMLLRWHNMTAVGTSSRNFIHRKLVAG